MIKIITSFIIISVINLSNALSMEVNQNNFIKDKVEISKIITDKAKKLGYRIDDWEILLVENKSEIQYVLNQIMDSKIREKLRNQNIYIISFGPRKNLNMVGGGIIFFIDSKTKEIFYYLRLQ